MQSEVAHEKERDKKAALSRIQITKEIQELIGKINRPHRYTSPFMLIMLIQALKQLNETQAQTISRGRLLQTSVSQRLSGQDTQAVQRFLSVVACTARRNGQRNAIQLANNRSPISRPR